MTRFCLIATLCLAISFSAHASSLSPTFSPYVEKAFQYQQQGNQLRAIRYLEQHKQRARTAYDNAYLAKLLGSWYWQQQLIQPAIDNFRFALTRDGLAPQEQAEITHYLAKLLFSQQRIDEAHTYYDLLTTKPLSAYVNPAEIWLALAQLELERRQFNASLDALKQLANYQAPNVSTLMLQLNAQTALKQWQALAQTYNKLIELEPSNKQWWFGQAASYYQYEQYSHALTTLNLAKLAGIHFTLNEQQQLLDLYIKSKLPAKAATIAAALYQQTSDLKWKIEEARLWQQAKMWDNAYERWQQISKIDAIYYVELAKLAWLQMRYQSALDALKQYPNLEQDPDAMLLMAYCYLNLSDHINAKKWAHNAYSLKPQTNTKALLAFLDKNNENQ